MENFKSFYDVLEEALKGKKVKLRSYEGYGTLPDHDWFKHKTTYHNGGGFKDEKVIGWNEKRKYNEWTGVVKKILFNNNSHVDIVFDDKQPRTKSNPKLLDDCFNWHMGDYVEILDNYYPPVKENKEKLTFDKEGMLIKVNS
jgi:hypothetical protein